jgi:hypothetical protein
MVPQCGHLPQIFDGLGFEDLREGTCDHTSFASICLPTRRLRRCCQRLVMTKNSRTTCLQ